MNKIINSNYLSRHICGNLLKYQPRNLQTRGLKSLKSEFRAFSKLLERSFPRELNQYNKPNILINRYIHASCQKFYSERNKNKDDDEKKKKEEEEAKMSRIYFMTLTFTALLLWVATSLMPRNKNESRASPFISWNEFVYHMLGKGEVEKITVQPELNLVIIDVFDNAIIKGKKSEHKTYVLSMVDADKFEDKLRLAEKSFGIPSEKGVPVVYERNSILTMILPIVLVAIAFVIWLMFKSGQIKTPQAMDFFSQMGRAKFTIVDPLTGVGKGVRFNDVAGLKEAKQEIMEFVDYLKKPEKYKVLGAKVPKGVLLLGPPGCGKTMLAKAVATEANVPFLAMAGSEFIEMIGGLGAARVRDLFREAKKRSPCIIYVDEIDAIGKRRSGGNMGGGTGEEEQTLNQLLVEMDGMATKEGVIMLASTNRADTLDKALLRPGRFDRHILIDLPTMIERREIFEKHLQVISLEKTPNFYSARLATLTPGFSGADIANVCNEAALHAARNKQVQVIGDNLEYAVERVVGGTEKRSNVMSPEEKKVVAYHESGHALVGWMLKNCDALLKISIVPRTTNVLGFAQYLPTDKKLYTKEQLFDRMCVALGGRAAEAIIFNRITTGAEDDLKRVTKMAYAQITQFGMDSVIGNLSFPTDEELGGDNFKGRKPFSKLLANTMDERARYLIAQAYRATEKVLNDNEEKLKRLAEHLLEKEVLNYDDIEKLIGPSPHGHKHTIESIDWGPNESSADIKSENPSDQ